MVRIAIIGTGGMANDHAYKFQKMDGCEVVACSDILPGRAKAFAEKYNIPAAYENTQEMLDKEQIDGVSVVTPDQYHKEPCLMAIERGIHVMCEKPLAPNLADAIEMAEAARAKGVLTAMNFSKRSVYGTQKAAQMVRNGEIGRVVHVEASYFQSWLVSKAWGDWRTEEAWLWRLSTKHGSAGVLGDIGVHIYDMASFIVGDIAEINCNLKTFDKGVDQIGDYVLDANDSFVATVKFENGAIGTVQATRWAVGYTNVEHIRVFGDKGALDLNFSRSGAETLKVCKGDDIEKDIWQPVDCPETPSTYSRFVESIKTGIQGQTSFDTGVKVQRYLDKSFVSSESGCFVKVM
ncbi:MAG: Gfo/Idh/MocA family oxidoreductase [Armatimonadetes bacterium]|nr:Gfo/Idh/MocA family oxidoreductase [Armatimonadota bacterium]